MLRRLAREISDRMGAFVLTLGLEEGSVVRYVALERGRVVDEYLSVPSTTARPPGEVIALGANPRLMARLTGADPDAVRAIARTASSPSSCPWPPSCSPAGLAFDSRRLRTATRRLPSARTRSSSPGRSPQAQRCFTRPRASEPA